MQADHARQQGAFGGGERVLGQLKSMRAISERNARAVRARPAATPAISLSHAEALARHAAAAGADQRPRSGGAADRPDRA